MSIKFILSVREDGKAPTRSIRFDLTPASQPGKPIFSKSLTRSGQVDVAAELPRNVRGLRFFLTDEKTGERIYSSRSVKVADVQDRYDVEINSETKDESVTKTFRIVIKDPKTNPMEGYSVQVLNASDPSDIVSSGVTDIDGYLPVNFVETSERSALIVQVRAPRMRDPIFVSDARKTGGIGKWWVVEVPDAEVRPQPPSEVVDPPRPPRPPIDTADEQPPYVPKPKLTPAERTRERLDHAEAQRDGVREGARSSIRRRKRILRKGRDIGTRFLGKKPLRNIGPSRGFVPAGEATRDRQDTIRDAALDRLGRQPRQSGGRISADRARELELRPGAPIKPEAFDRLFPTGPRETFLPPHWGNVVRDCASGLLARKAQENNGIGNDGEVVPKADVQQIVAAPAPDPSNLSTSDRIGMILDAALGTPENRPTTADLMQSLTTELPSGAADVDAFYDYHAIQVAWSETWTALVDDDMKNRFKELYDSIVEVVDPEDIDADLSEITELHDMLDTLEDSVAAASLTLTGTASTAPEHLQGWISDVAEVWEYLTENEQDYVALQYELDEFMSPMPANHSADFLDGKRIEQFQNYPDGWVPHKWASVLAAEMVFNSDYFVDRARSFVDLDRAKGKQDAPDTTFSTNAASRLGRAERLIGELKEQLVAPYQFDVFAPGSYNFGTLVTYRQRWRPINYQPGDLAGAIPLAPNEKRSYSITQKVSETFTKQTDRSTFFKVFDETTQTRRAEAEIAAEVKRNTSVGGDLSVNSDYFKIAEVTANTNFDTSQESASNQIKKEIRELTAKVSHEYRDEHKTSVKVESTRETEFTETRELSNPNNELTVTYLFYELQRRYEVNERLHNLEPVVFVAFDMPQPSEITEAWLLKYDWIIRKHLLDASFHDALDYLSKTFAGDEVAVEILEQQWKTQLAVVTDLRRQGRAHQSLRDAARGAVEESVSAVAYADAGEAANRGIGRGFAKRLYAAEGELAEGDAENARTSLEWAEQDLNRIEASAREAMTALESATNAYVAAVEKRLNRRVQIDRLILHVKDNILHYMQAIWTNEHPDQRYLRLYDMEIQWPGERAGTYMDTVTQSTVIPWSDLGWPSWLPNPNEGLTGEITFEVPKFRQERVLHEVADLGRLLGFKGNLAMFPLIKHNALTSFMAQEFLDGQFGLSDPDVTGFIPTASEALEIAECAWKNPELNDRGRKNVTEWLMDALGKAHQVSQEIVIPTGELFIEALPGAHPLLEDFKLRHRAFDAAQAATGVRASQLDLIRRAMRLEEGDGSDPDVDRNIAVTGSIVPTINLLDEE